MRYLRQTIYDPGGNAEPIVIVNPESAFKVNIWTAATFLREKVCKDSVNEFIEIEIFDHDGDGVSAAIEARRRSERRMDETQCHRLTLYDWLISLFQNELLADNATISTSRPSPLEKKDLFEVIIEATKHPFYRGAVVTIHDRNGEPVSVHMEKKEETK
jgi:hypothetical protein